MDHDLHLFHEAQVKYYLDCEDLREWIFLTREMRQPSKKPPPTMAAKAVIMVVVVENTGWYDSGSGKTKRTLKVLKIYVKLTNYA